MLPAPPPKPLLTQLFRHPTDLVDLDELAQRLQTCGRLRCALLLAGSDAAAASGPQRAVARSPSGEAFLLSVEDLGGPPLALAELTVSPAGHLRRRRLDEHLNGFHTKKETGPPGVLAAVHAAWHAPCRTFGKLWTIASDSWGNHNEFRMELRSSAQLIGAGPAPFSRESVHAGGPCLSTRWLCSSSVLLSVPMYQCLSRAPGAGGAPGSLGSCVAASDSCTNANYLLSSRQGLWTCSHGPLDPWEELPGGRLPDSLDSLTLHAHGGKVSLPRRAACGLGCRRSNNCAHGWRLHCQLLAVAPAAAATHSPLPYWAAVFPMQLTCLVVSQGRATEQDRSQLRVLQLDAASDGSAWQAVPGGCLGLPASEHGFCAAASSYQVG